MTPFYSAFPEDPKICPVRALQCYEERSKGLRSNPLSRNPLFILVRKPHKPVKAATIGHWLKSVMHSSGIDTNIFSAHSTHGTATSNAKSAGVSAADILKAASWSSTSTFSCFYHRPIDSGQFGRGVLKQQLPTLVSFKHCCSVSGASKIQYHRFLKDCSNLMRRMKCKRRWRIHGNNIVSLPLLFPIILYIDSQNTETSTSLLN